MNSELGILLPAMLAGVLVLSTHIPFGLRVLQRGVIFADLAVAQIAGLGVILAGLLELEHHTVAVQLIAAASALTGAALLAWIERHADDTKEAYIGLAFVLTASLGILLMSRNVHAGEHLQDLLVGQILWVSPTQLAATALLYAALWLLWQRLAQQPHPFAFYAPFALAVTASVQLVGVYLVFASLIVPALATYRWPRRRLPWAYAIGLGGYAAGLWLSAAFDLPAGAAITCALALIAAPVALLKRPLQRL